MAFNKDPKQLQSMPSFRQQAAAQQQARPKNKGTGATPYFVNRFQPLTDEEDRIRIIRGHYEVPMGQQDGSVITQVLYYYPYIEHFHGTLKKGAICSAGPLGMFKGKGDPCLGCEMFWADKNAGKKNGPMSRRELSAFTVLHYAPYAKVEQTDAQGVVRRNDKGEPYYEWVRVRSYERVKYKDKEMREYNVMHWSLGFAHFNVLMEQDKLIGRSCKSCGGKDTIVCEAWTCQHCGEALIEPSTTTLSPKEIENLTMHPVRCASCQQEGMLQEIISCSQCQNAVRAEVFDVDLDLRRVMPPGGGNQSTLMISSWSAPRPIDQRLQEFAKPLPLDKIFAPTPYEKQQSMWGGGVRQPVTGQALDRPYTGAPTLGGNKPQY